MRKALLLLFLPLSVFADQLFEPVTSNVQTVKGWLREQLTYDETSGQFSRPEFPTRSQAIAAKQIADAIPGILQEATDALNQQLLPIQSNLTAHASRPVCMIVAAADPDNAVDRQNLTMVVLSNQITRTTSGVHVAAWVYGNQTLSSKPIMKARALTDFGNTASWQNVTWTSYATNETTIVRGGEDYDTYKLTFDIPGEVSTNLTVYLNPWVKIGLPDKQFDFGNRQRRINNVLCCTTNDLSFLGRFYTTNGVEMTGFTPYADRGEFRFEEKESE